MENSPARDSDLPLSHRFGSDYFGTQRPQGNGWDIGAYEYSGTGSLCGSSDSNSDNILKIGELIDYISSWKEGSVTIGDLMNAIGEWKDGC